MLVNVSPLEYGHTLVIPNVHDGIHQVSLEVERKPFILFIDLWNSDLCRHHCFSFIP